VSIIAHVLRHSTLAMSQKHYISANGVKAMSDLQQVIGELRRDGKRREREMRRKRDPRAGLPDALAAACRFVRAADGDKR
jgi:hypothetical protein